VPQFDVYSRRGCHLCERLIEELGDLVRDRAGLAVHDVDSRPAWRERYASAVPVVEFGGRELCRYRLDRGAVLAALAGER
jgi:hypothetical protein